ncbi:MAG: hypothetical protein RIT26_226 [Pseudomonadota bacterium]
MTADTLTLRLPATLRQAQAMAWLQGLALPTRGQTAVLDASDLVSFDSAALACLLELRRRAQAGAWHIRVEGLPERVQRLAQVYGLVELI